MLCWNAPFVPHGENSEPGSTVLRTDRAYSERGCRTFTAPPSVVATHDRRVTFRDGCTLAVLQARVDSRSFGLRAGRELASLTVCSPCRCRSPRRPRALAPPQACAVRAVTMLAARVPIAPATPAWLLAPTLSFQDTEAKPRLKAVAAL
jgi:hypothetical protein